MLRPLHSFLEIYVKPFRLHLMAVIVFLLLILILTNLSNKKSEPEIILKVATPEELNISQKTEVLIPLSDTN